MAVQVQTTSNKVNEGEKPQGIISKFIGIFKTWLDLLMGKPRYKVPSPGQASSGIQRSKGQVSPEEDSITKDIQSVKRFIKKTFTGVSDRVQPVVKKKSEASSKRVLRIVDAKIFSRIVRIFFILLFLLLLAYISVKVFQLLQDNGDGGETTILTTPTIVPYKPSIPSVYTDDEIILELEEKFKVLEREIAGTNIRETILTPPYLDYNIDFED